MDRGRGEKGYPAIGTGWIAATEYCRWLSRKTGRSYRLPTEEEWEYACRAGTTTAFFWGDDPGKAGEYGWFKENSAGGDFPQTTHPLGKLRPNPFGLYDIVGNVAEWGGKPGGSAPHVARGGAFSTAAAQLRSASRLIETPEWDELDPEYPHSPWWLTAEFVRFRLALDATEPLKK